MADTQTDPTPTPTPAPAAEPEVPEVPKGRYVHVLRNFSGYLTGEVVNASDWIHTASLIESRHVTPADKDLVRSSHSCSACRKRWVDEDAFLTHPCVFTED